jgi:hypothetical protein
MYQARNIKFAEILKWNDWRIKSYTISEKDVFSSFRTYRTAVDQLPDWLVQLNSFNPSHENMAFLIVHEASEGIFSLINTWVGNNMLQTHIFLAGYDDPESFTKISGDGLFACVWELEIIQHERISWISNILKKPKNPDYENYLKDTLTTTI